MTKEEEELKQENAVNMKIASKSLLEMKNERDKSLQENQHLTDYIIKANAQIEELMRDNERMSEAARKVVSESTSVYCHYNNLVSEKEYIGFENIKELNFLVSKNESNNQNGGKCG